MPSSTPVSGVSGVVGTLAEIRPPAWSITTSVKVPPTSTPMRQAGLSLCHGISVRFVFAERRNLVLVAEAEYPSLFLFDRAAFTLPTGRARSCEQWGKAAPSVQQRKCRCIDADLGPVEDFSITLARRNLIPEKRGVDFREHERRFAGYRAAATRYRRARLLPRPPMRGSASSRFKAGRPTSTCEPTEPG